MPRSRAAYPARKYRAEVEAARRDLDSVATSAHPFAAAACERRLRPETPLDAFTIAFAAALDEVLAARYAQRISQEPQERQPERAVAERFGRSLGLSRATIRATRDGDRWVQLPEVLAGLKAVGGFGPFFRRHLDVLLRAWPYLLHKDSLGHPTLSFTRGTEADAADPDAVDTDREPQTLKEKDVLHLEQQARVAIRELAAAQQRVAEKGGALPSAVDWQAVADALDPRRKAGRVEPSQTPDPERPRPGRRTPGVKSLSDLGIDNLNADVLAAFDDGRPHKASDVITHIQAVARQRQIAQHLDIEPVPDDSIRSALWRLHSRPADRTNRWLVHEGRTYKPGPRWLREKGSRADS